MTDQFLDLRFQLSENNGLPPNFAWRVEWVTYTNSDSCAEGSVFRRGTTPVITGGICTVPGVLPGQGSSFRATVLVDTFIGWDPAVPNEPGEPRNLPNQCFSAGGVEPAIFYARFSGLPNLDSSRDRGMRVPVSAK